MSRLLEAPKIIDSTGHELRAGRMRPHPHGQWIRMSRYRDDVGRLRAYAGRLLQALNAAREDVARLDFLELEALKVRELGDPATLREAIDQKRGAR